MAKYKLSRDGNSVVDTEENITIPIAPGNRHYQEYREWLSQGNVPDIEIIPPPNYIKENYQKLWEAATSYTEYYISGAAYSLVTIGLLQKRPKCIAVQQWIQSIWNLYYQRKYYIKKEPISDELLDFSVCGPMPYSVPELTSEVYN